ncbi:MAG: hypothetical protein KDC07_10165, partial [Chitinophagaceae bacterium]|nr:hypothetical protein [Chitinophagaceae bacterium]
PCYFIAYAQNGDVIIENAGTSGEKYTCRFRDDNGIEQIVTSRNTAAGETIKMRIPNKKINPVTVEITSGLNNRLTKHIAL